MQIGGECNYKIDLKEGKMEKSLLKSSIHRNNGWMQLYPKFGRRVKGKITTRTSISGNQGGVGLGE
jgi:hypothetical protein